MELLVAIYTLYEFRINFFIFFAWIKIYEYYYQMVIHEKLEKIKAYDEALSERIKKDFFQELSTLDAAYQTMKRELVESQSNEQVISAMIHNLQLRIDVLNKQLEILNEIEEQSKNIENNETINL